MTNAAPVTPSRRSALPAHSRSHVARYFLIGFHFFCGLRGGILRLSQIIVRYAAPFNCNLTGRWCPFNPRIVSN